MTTKTTKRCLDDDDTDGVDSTVTLGATTKTTEADRRRLRELAFGPAPSPSAKKEKIGVVATAPVVPPQNRLFIPLACILLGTLVLVWSLNRCIDYSEVFQASRRARYGIVLANTALLLLLLWIAFTNGGR